MKNYFYIKEVTEVVRKRHGQEAEHIQTVLVNQIAEGGVVWNIAVEVFGLRWNPRAKRCYAWGQPKAGGGWDITTVLETRPIVSAAHSAVKVAFAAESETLCRLECNRRDRFVGLSRASVGMGSACFPPNRPFPGKGSKILSICGPARLMLPLPHDHMKKDAFVFVCMRRAARGQSSILH